MGKCRTKPSKRCNREDVTKTNFRLRNLTWSPWKVGMAEKSPDDESEEWIPRRGEGYGVRRSGLFQNGSDTAAVYEFAVQTARRCRKHPVYVSCTAGFSGLQWDTYLLKQGHLSGQVDNVLRKGCKLFVRRAKVNTPQRVDDKTVKSVQELRHLIRQTYDYAWSKVPTTSTRGAVRSLTKRGVDLTCTAC